MNTNNTANDIVETAPGCAPNAPIEDMEPWEPLVKPTMLAMRKDMCDLFGKDPEALIDNDVWMNNLYVVSRRLLSAEIAHLSIRRLDRAAAKDWRHFQWIKNQLVGEECEAMEIYPAESRLMDSANQYHLWCIIKPGERLAIGWDERLVMEESSMGSVQRRWPDNMRPGDLTTTEQLKAMVADENEAQEKRAE